MDLHGKVALVTGAAKRLGRSIAITLAEGGADLVLHVHTSSGEDTAQAVQALGRRALVIRADLSRATALSRFLQDTLHTAGQVDVLVNNAAVFFPTPVSSLDVDTWQTVLRANLTAPFVLALSFGRMMRARGWGSIVHLSDWSGMRPVPGYLPYCVSKGGLAALTQGLAKALAPQVHVNSVALGPVLVPDHYGVPARRALAARTPLGRLGNRTDVARSVRFLVERGGFVTGATYLIDGGWFARAPEGIGTSL